MGINLQILGLQAIPRLAEKLSLDLEDFLTFPDLYGMAPEEFQKTCDKYGKILDHFVREKRISWWNIYSNSDIGMERIALARDIGLEKDDTVLEIGCGRGYFTVAAARFSKKVIGLDLMNGMGRYEWWRSFREFIAEMNLKRKVLGLRADAQSISIKDCSVTKVVAVHCIRNFKDKRAIQNTIGEMYRVLSKDGEMVVVENISLAKNKSQEAHLAFYKCKCKYSGGDIFYLSREELLEMFQKAGIGEVHSNIVDYNLSATPPIFYLNASLLKKEQIENAQKEYAEAVDMIRKYGETSPPALIIRVTKHPK